MKKMILVVLSVFFLFSFTLPSFGSKAITCWFPPGWKSKGSQAKAITEALSQKSGFPIRPRIAKSYPQIIEAFSTDDYSLVYVGSFVQTIIHARDLGTPLPMWGASWSDIRPL